MSSPSQITALIFDTSPALSTALAESGIAARPGSSAELAESAAETVAIVDARGTLAGAVASHLRQLRAAAPELPVVVVCAEVRPGEIRQALAAGANGVLLEASLGEGLRPCLAAVLAGQVCVPRRQARQVEAATLSAREKQILGLVVMGYMNGEIGERLFVAESTVKSHLSSAFGKLGVGSRNEAVELILDGERGLGIGILGLESEPIAS